MKEERKKKQTDISFSTHWIFNHISQPLNFYKILKRLLYIFEWNINYSIFPKLLSNRVKMITLLSK
jgi:hypothetical protein